MKKSRKLILLLICNLLAISILQSQTSMFGTNPQHSGYYNSHFRSDLKLVKKWKYKTNGRIFSTAAISNNVLFIGSDDSCLYAISTEGNLKWKFKTTGMVRSAPAVKDTIVYFNNYDSIFYAVGVKSGKEIWRYKTSGEKVNKNYFGYNPATKIYEDQWDVYQSSPVIVDSLIYFGSGTSMYALNLNTKSLLWKYTPGKVIHSTPAVSKGAVFFGCWDSKVYSVDAIKGTIIWIFETGTDPTYHTMEGIASSPSVVDTIVYVGSRDGNVYALNAKNGKQIWKTGFNGSWMPSSFAVSSDTLYTGSSDSKSFFGINRFTGAVLSTMVTNCYDFSTPAITNETGFAGCMNGSLYAFSRSKGKIITRFDTDARKRNFRNAVNTDGSLNQYYFDPVSTSEYSDAIEYMNRLYSTGSILSTPVISNNVVFFGSTDSCLYAVHDDGTCRPNIFIKTGVYDLETISKEKETSFYVRNYGDCLDSVKLYISSPETLKTAVTFDPQNFVVDPEDSVEVKLKINCKNLKTANYQLIIGVVSKSNIYKYFNSTYNFKVFTALNGTDINQNLKVFPNPFSNTTIIKFNIVDKNSFNLGIYNLSGQKLKNFAHGLKVNGEHTVIWDGTNDKGVKLPSGLYLVCISNGEETSSQLITIQR